MFRSCAFFVHAAKMQLGTERMREAARKILVFVLSVGLAASTPVLSHAQRGHSGAAASHASHAVQNYADLAIDPGQDECPHAGTTQQQSNDDGLCNKCCAACMVASLIPAVPPTVWVPLVARDTFVTQADILIARIVPTEPGIPKRL
jgi:hypothetical protein